VSFVGNYPVRFNDPNGHDVGCPGCYEREQQILASSVRLASLAVDQSGANLIGGGGIGTIIGQKTILTHNHWENEGPRLEEADVIRLYENSMAPSEISGQVRIAYQGETTLISGSLNLNNPPLPIASAADIAKIGPGAWLDVVYEESDILKMTSFQVVSNQQFIFTLNNSNGVINLGDSGGGIFHNGQLVANTWYIDPVAGTFTAHKIPSVVYDQGWRNWMERKPNEN
jgi:hypothetical protein